jgi:hypothetical protein
MSATQQPDHPVLTMTQAHVDQYLPGAENGEIVHFVGMRRNAEGKLEHCMAGEETKFKLEITESAVQ